MSTPSNENQVGATQDDSATGLPLFRNWRAVYLFVTACFALWVVLLALLPRVFA
ncbi:MAG: hypothetical protein KF805_03970 [Phycisphaeraceae bacterium]|nr:hypothetical protein [Phycisphaeraceae bacterium]